MTTDITKLLNESKPLTVSFTKKDGTIRHMRCTTNLNLIPDEHHPKNKDNNSVSMVLNDNVIRVYDLQNEGWRSFITTNVISFESTEY
jgi:hypothetical protein